MPLILGSQSAATAAAGYTIDNSCRFNRPSSPYLNWTPTAGGDDQIFTFSFWAKRSLINGPPECVTAYLLFNGSASYSSVARLSRKV